MNLTATVPCDVVRSMPPIGGLVLGTAPEDGKQAALNAMLVNVTATRVDVIVRNVVVASVPRARVVSPQCQRIEITSSEAGTFATFVGLTDPTSGKELRSGFADPNLRPAIVGVFTELTGPAPPGLSLSATIDTRFSTKPTVLKLTAMVLAIAATVVALVALWRLDQLDGRRMRRVIPARWRTFTAHRRHRGRRVPAVACDRRELVGRRLHPRHGPGRRARRLHVELLPLVRQPGGPVRLVLQPAGADDARQRRQHLDPAAGSRCGAGVLAAAVPRGAAPARPGGGVQQGRGVGGGPGAAGGVDAVQQRPAARSDHRDRRADHLRADRAGHRVRPDDARRHWPS